MAAFFYASVRDVDAPTKNLIVADGQDERFSVAQFDAAVYAYAKGLSEGLGLQRGTKVALWMTNELEQMVVHCAASLTGATVLTIDPRLPIDAVQHVIDVESARALVVSPRFGAVDRAQSLTSDFEAELEPFVSGAVWGYDSLRSKRFRALKYIVQSGFDEVPGVINLADLYVMGDDGSHDHESIAAMQHPVAADDVTTIEYRRSADGAQTLARTPATHKQTLASARACAAGLGLAPTDVIVVTAPLFSHFGYAGGALAALQSQAKLVIPSREFDAAATLAAISAQRGTHLVCTPEQASELAVVLARDTAGSKAYATDSLRGGIMLAGSAGGASAKLGGATIQSISAAKLSGAAPWA